jgi:LemA protein
VRPWLAALLLLCACGLSGCGYRALQLQDEDVQAAWSEVASQYRFRADLVPTLLSMVKGYATPEQQALVGLTEARARVGSIPLTPELLNDPQAFAKFQLTQEQLSEALRSLFAVTDTYPQLRTDANFRDLLTQLEGTESRISLARSRYSEAVRGFNNTVRSFPASLTARMFDFQAKPTFSVTDEPASGTPATIEASGPPPRGPLHRP